MKVVRNRMLPFGGFTAINLFGVVFTRMDGLSERTLRHEAVHTAQMREMLYVPFYLWYAVEWLVRLVQCRFRPLDAYVSVSFEREAYAHQDDKDYLEGRRRFAWRGFTGKRNG